MTDQDILLSELGFSSDDVNLKLLRDLPDIDLDRDVRKGAGDALVKQHELNDLMNDVIGIHTPPVQLDLKPARAPLSKGIPGNHEAWCDLCKKGFMSKETLDMHFKISHPDDFQKMRKFAPARFSAEFKSHKQQIQELITRSGAGEDLSAEELESLVSVISQYLTAQIKDLRRN